MSTNTADQLYESYLRGFGRLLPPDERGLPIFSAYALGTRDRANSVEQTANDALGTRNTGPHLRTCGEVLDVIRSMVPQPQAVPIDVDRIIRDNVTLAQQVQALTKKESDEDASLVELNGDLQIALKRFRDLDEGVRHLVGSDAKGSTVEVVELAGLALAEIARRVGARGTTLTDIVAAMQASDASTSSAEVRDAAEA